MWNFVAVLGLTAAGIWLIFAVENAEIFTALVFVLTLITIFIVDRRR